MGAQTEEEEQRRFCWADAKENTLARRNVADRVSDTQGCKKHLKKKKKKKKKRIVQDAKAN